MKAVLFTVAATLAASFGVAACVPYPVSAIEQGGHASGGISFTGAPAGALVLIDGVAAGEAATYDGRKTILSVQPGTHRVAVMAGATTLYDQSVYIGAGSRLAIKVN